MNKLKILLLMILISVIPLMLSAVTTDTPADSGITNIVTAIYSNEGGNDYTNNCTNTANVLAIYGVSTTVTSSTTAYTVPNSPVYFYGNVVNEGNTNQIVYFTNLLSEYGGGYSGWDVDVYATNKTTLITSMTLSEDAIGEFYLRVNPTNTALPGQSMTNKIAANFLTNLCRYTKVSNYIGLNSTNYAGYWLTTGRITITIIHAPVIEIVKHSFVTNHLSYIALGGDPHDVVPGAKITYAITWTNSGGADAYGLELSDPLDSNVTYATGSMRYRDNSRTDATPANYPVVGNKLSDAGGLEDLGAYKCNGNSNGGSGPIEFKFNAAIQAGKSGTVYFKVYVK